METPNGTIFDRLEAYALISHEIHRHHDAEFAAFLHRDERVSLEQQQLRGMIRDPLGDAARIGTWVTMSRRMN